MKINTKQQKKLSRYEQSEKKRMIYTFIYYYAFLYINYDFILYPIIWGNFPIGLNGQWGNFPIKVKQPITSLGIFSH